MKLLFGFLILYLLLPFVGLFTFSPHQANLYGDIDLSMKVSGFIHICIVFFLIVFISFFGVKKRNFTPFMLSDVKVVSIYKKCFLVLTFCFVTMLFFGVGDIVLGRVGRGDFRSTLGGFGFFYNFVTMFLPAGIIALASAIYLTSSRCSIIMRRLICIYICAIFLGIMTGFKYTALLISSAGLIQLSGVINFTRLFIIATLFSGGMLFSATYFMNLNPEDAAYYLFARATSVASEGTVGIWNYFPAGGEDAWMALLYGFGNRLSSLLIGYDVQSVDFLKVNITRLIGYLTYPKPEEALSGAFNLTVTNFGEGVYYFGRDLFFIFSIISGAIVGLVIRFYRRSLTNGTILLNTMAVIYISIVLLPWLMGGAIGNLYGIPTIVYMSLLYFFLRFTLAIQTGQRH